MRRLTLSEAIATNRVGEFAIQAEADGIGPVDRTQFEAMVGRITAPLSEDQTSRSRARGGSRGVRGMLSETGFSVADDGVIWRDRFTVDESAIAVSLVADASARAAAYMLARGKVHAGQPLDQRLRDAMRVRFPQGHAHFEFAGKHRQHKFDFGLVEGERTILVQSVNPEQSSISSAIVKGLDSKAVEGANVVPIFVFDPSDHWPSGSLKMLELGGASIEIDAVRNGLLPMAA